MSFFDHNPEDERDIMMLKHIMFGAVILLGASSIALTIWLIIAGIFQ